MMYWIVIVLGPLFSHPGLAQERALLPAVGAFLSHLRSSEIGDRERGERQLRRLTVQWIPLLRSLVAGERELEVSERLRNILRTIALREADRQYREGCMEETLHYLAESEGAARPEDFVIRRKSDVKARIRSWISEGSVTEDFPSPFEGLAQSIEIEFGPWGVAVLLEVLENEPGGEIPAGSILEQMGDPVIPSLVRALGRGKVRMVKEICLVLHDITFSRETDPETGARLLLSLSSTSLDPTMDPWSRIRSRHLLSQLLLRSRQELYSPFRGWAP